MPYEFKAVRRVEFSETDMAGIVHFSNFFRYMETAEHAFYRSLGFSVTLNHLEPPLGFPRVHAACDYKKPLRFEDRVEIHILVKEKRSRVLSYLFRFSKLPREGTDEKPVLVATGVLTVVCVAHDRNGKMEAAAIPADLANHIEVAPVELLQTN
jgi:YbgC/YbaW family acyl-CoA thioester hydrolase